MGKIGKVAVVAAVAAFVISLVPAAFASEFNPAGADGNQSAEQGAPSFQPVAKAVDINSALSNCRGGSKCPQDNVVEPIYPGKPTVKVPTPQPVPTCRGGRCPNPNPDTEILPITGKPVDAVVHPPIAPSDPNYNSQTISDKVTDEKGQLISYTVKGYLNGVYFEKRISNIKYDENGKRVSWHTEGELYNAFGKPLTWSLDYANAQYDSQGLIQSYSVVGKWNGKNVDLNRSYTRNPQGQITTVVETGTINGKVIDHTDSNITYDQNNRRVGFDRDYSSKSHQTDFKMSGVQYDEYNRITGYQKEWTKGGKSFNLTVTQGYDKQGNAHLIHSILVITSKDGTQVIEHHNKWHEMK